MSLPPSLLLWSKKCHISHFRLILPCWLPPCPASSRTLIPRQSLYTLITLSSRCNFYRHKHASFILNNFLTLYFSLAIPSILCSHPIPNHTHAVFTPSPSQPFFSALQSGFYSTSLKQPLLTWPKTSISPNSKVKFMSASQV